VNATLASAGVSKNSLAAKQSRLLYPRIVECLREPFAPVIGANHKARNETERLLDRVIIYLTISFKIGPIVDGVCERQTSSTGS